MKIRLAVAWFTLLTLGLAPFAAAQSAEQAQRLAASVLLAYGRPAEGNEVQRLALQGEADVDQLFARHREQIAGHPEQRAEVARRAAQDAFGLATPAPVSSPASDAAVTYLEHVRQHLDRLEAQPQEYAEVIRRAYEFVVRRDAYPEEIKYWQKYDTLSYALLVGCIENWGRRNQPGLMVTAGVPTVSINSEFLATVRLSPAVAAEFRAAVGLPLLTEPGDAARGHNLIAPGSTSLFTDGRMHFAAVGGPALFPAPSRTK